MQCRLGLKQAALLGSEGWEVRREGGEEGGEEKKMGGEGEVRGREGREGMSENT